MGVEEFATAAREIGVTVQARRFPEGTRTAAQAAEAIGCDVAQIVKSLVFVADGTPVLALVSGSNRADPERLAAAVGASQVRLASPDEVHELTGFAIGGTPPFGHRRRLAAVADRDLLAHEECWAAAGSPDACFPIAPEDLLAVTGADVTDIAAR